jgi:hypothetical protein
MFTEDEIARKLPVWHALARQFLDTELQSSDYAFIGRQLRASGYSAEELRRILEIEVAPAFAFNLCDVAGEWLPWSEEEVRTIMLNHRANPQQWLEEGRLQTIVSAIWADLLPSLDS